jgi:hypothetical protein
MPLPVITVISNDISIAIANDACPGDTSILIRDAGNSGGARDGVAV